MPFRHNQRANKTAAGFNPPYLHAYINVNSLQMVAVSNK